MEFVFPTMHIKERSHNAVVGEERGIDDENGHRRKKYCVICYANGRLRTKFTKLEKLKNYWNGGRSMHRCELCLSPGK